MNDVVPVRSVAGGLWSVTVTVTGPAEPAAGSVTLNEVSDEGVIVIGLDAPKVTESVPVPMNPHPEIVSVAPPAVKSAAGEIPLTANGPQLAAHQFENAYLDYEAAYLQATK